MTYELWNARTGNAIGEFSTEREALAMVREVIERNGRSYADMLFLGVTSKGRSKPVAKGQALADRALVSAADAGVPVAV